jgi:hypothetical protein
VARRLAQYGLTRDEIFVAIDAGKLQYGPRAMHGKRWLRLLRREIEDLAMSLHGDPDLPEQQPRTERAQVNRELRQIPDAAAGTPCSMIRRAASSCPVVIHEAHQYPGSGNSASTPLPDWPPWPADTCPLRTLA